MYDVSNVIGKPVNSPDSIDYVPSLFKFNEVTPNKKKQNEARDARLEKRRKTAEKNVAERLEIESAANALLKSSDTCANVSTQTTPTIMVNKETFTETVKVREQSTQTSINLSSSSDDSAFTPLSSTLLYPHQLVDNDQEKRFSVAVIKENDSRSIFYTGLPWKLFEYVFKFISIYVPKSRTSFSQENELLLVIMRLRLNLHLEDLAVRFSVSTSTAGFIFQKWIDVMFVRLQFLIKWPSKKVVKGNMPQIFKDLYPSCRCIIDCSEIFIERSLSFQARAQTYSNYKKHNTIKFLIAITPNGVVSFISKCCRGLVTDKVITQESGLLQLLEPGDLALADRGFNVAEDVAMHMAKLEIPAFCRGVRQLSQRDTECSAKLSKVRIHVERVIGLLKNKYSILQGPLPVNLVKHFNDNESANIDKLLTVCVALTNLSKPIVPF